jgi:hypothetical protein
MKLLTSEIKDRLLENGRKQEPVGIPVKLNACSEGKPNGIPG